MIRHATGYRLTEFGKELRPGRTRRKAVDLVERYLVAANQTADRLGSGDMFGVDRLPADAVTAARDFHSRHPGLRVELIMSDHFLDIAKGEADVAIRAGVPNEETLVGRKIADVPWALYCSHAYLAATAG